MERNLNGWSWVLLTNRKHKTLFFSTIDVSRKKKRKLKILVYSGLITGAIYRIGTNKL